MKKRRGSPVLYLPNVGPFASLGKKNIFSLRNVYIQGLASYALTPSSPLICNRLIFISGSILYQGLYRSQFIWCNRIERSIPGTTTIYASGDSVDSSFDGVGGNGASGGGAGGVDDPSYYDGFDGGTEGSDGGGSPFFNGGVGLANDFTDDYSWDSGGDGGAGGTIGKTIPGAGGLGAERCGGGGGGGSSDAGIVWGGGGGGGGGIISIVCREIATPLNLLANGGDGGDNFVEANGGGGGGGGVVLIYAKKYSGNATPNTSGGLGAFGALPGSSGNAKIYEISRDERTVTLRSFSDTWDNL